MDRSAWENQENNSVFDVAAGLEAQGIMWAEQHAAPWQKKSNFAIFVVDFPDKSGAREELERVKWGCHFPENHSPGDTFAVL